MSHILSAEITVCEGCATWKFTCDEPADAPCRRHCKWSDGQGCCYHLGEPCEWVENDCGIVESLNVDPAASAEGQHNEFMAWTGKVEATWDGDDWNFEPVTEPNETLADPSIRREEKS